MKSLKAHKTMKPDLRLVVVITTALFFNETLKFS